MKLQLKEDPREWRKQAWLTLLALAILGGILCWQGVLLVSWWLVSLLLFAFVGLLAVRRPVWFRGYYRFAMRVGFGLSLILGRLLLALIFLLLVTPLGLFLRLGGKDLLRLKRPQPGQSCWREAREPSPLDSVF